MLDGCVVKLWVVGSSTKKLDFLYSDLWQIFLTFDFKILELGGLVFRQDSHWIEY